MAQIIQLRRGTTAQWAASNVVLAEGEMGLELRPSLAPLAKVGDGQRVWSQLPYFSGGGVTTPTLAPVNTVIPTISGVLTQGEVLTGADGTWSNLPTSYIRQWKRDGQPISGAANQTYLLVADDVGKSITYGVVAANASGSGLEAVSAATAVIQPAVVNQAPIQITAPFFADTTALVGETITVTPGTYIGNPAPTVTRAWKRNNVVIVGATGVQYTVTAEGTYTVTETVTNSEGTITRNSTNSVAVTPVPVLPGAPQGFSAGASGSTYQVLNWVAPSTGFPATYTYTITRRTGGGAYGNEVTTAAGATTATITGLPASTSVDYLIVATNTTGTGPTAALNGISTTAVSGGADVVFATDVYESGVFAV